MDQQWAVHVSAVKREEVLISLAQNKKASQMCAHGYKSCVTPSQKSKTTSTTLLCYLEALLLGKLPSQGLYCDLKGVMSEPQ